MITAAGKPQVTPVKAVKVWYVCPLVWWALAQPDLADRGSFVQSREILRPADLFLQDYQYPAVHPVTWSPFMHRGLRIPSVGCIP